MDDGSLFSVKMRASRQDTHVSGAERIVSAKAVPDTARALVARALSHSKGFPDFISLKVAGTRGIMRVKAPAVATEHASSPEEGLEIAARLLRESGVENASAIVAMMPLCRNMRGAMLVDADSLARLEPDHARGVRVSSMDAAGLQGRLPPSAKSHYAEAVVLASKVAAAPGVIAEICISDDPEYVTGYVASGTVGYRRIDCMKRIGDPTGGRIFVCRGIAGDPSPTIRFLQETPVLVDGIPSLDSSATGPSWRNSVDSELASIRSAALWRRTQVHCKPSGTAATVDGRRLSVLSSNGYLNLAFDHRVKAAAAGAALDYGAGTGGARLTTGTFHIHAELERRLAAFLGCDAAVSFATGYMANMGAIQAIAGKGDAILSDELNHASIIDGCRLSGADAFIYRHCDMDDLRAKLSACGGYRRRLVVSDGVFSMDGDLAPLPSIVELCSRFDAISMIDDAHAIGVVGATGRGTAEHFNCPRADVTIGTLSKALGAEGGFAATSQRLASLIVNRARPFIFSTSPAPASVGAALAALDILESEPWRVERLRGNVALFLRELASRGIPAETQSAIVPVAIGDEARALKVSAHLMDMGLLVSAIRHPTVPRGSARLRVSISSAHDPSTIVAAAAAIASAL